VRQAKNEHGGLRKIAALVVRPSSPKPAQTSKFKFTAPNSEKKNFSDKKSQRNHNSNLIFNFTLTDVIPKDCSFSFPFQIPTTIL
jgi:hypothetical protein